MSRNIMRMYMIAGFMWLEKRVNIYPNTNLTEATFNLRYFFTHLHKFPYFQSTLTVFLATVIPENQNLLCFNQYIIHTYLSRGYIISRKLRYLTENKKVLFNQAKS